MFVPAPASKSPRGQPGDWLWWAFLVWTAIGFAVLPLNIEAVQLHAWIADDTLRRFVAAFLRQADAIWILLAAANAYLHTAASEGRATAFRWAAIILLVSMVIETVGVRTGLPFGPYRYTGNFGWQLPGGVPAAIPLAWLVILLCGRYFILAIWVRPPRVALAIGVGFVALLTDLNLEFVAWKVRGYWVWYPDQGVHAPTWPPWQNYASWFGLNCLLTLLLTQDGRPMNERPPATRPILTLALMNTLFVCAQIVHWQSQN